MSGRNAHLQQQIEWNRERIQTLEENDQTARSGRKRHMATTRKTAQGDRVNKWPDPEPVYGLIEKVDEAMRELFAEANARAQANAAMSQQAHPGSERFPALKGGQ